MQICKEKIEKTWEKVIIKETKAQRDAKKEDFFKKLIDENVLVD